MQKMYYEDQTFKKKIKENHWKLEKKNVEQVQTKEDKMTKRIRSLGNFGRFKTFGIWWKMSEYIIGSAKLAFCYIDQLGQVDEILEYEENWPKKLQVSE